MSVKTIRFNKQEETSLKKILAYYQEDFSTCIKELLAEKLEDLADIKHINRIREAHQEDYLTASEINALAKKKAA